jgi:2-haloacid dehalogenase
MDEKALGGALQSARKAAGLTQQQLCQKSGLSYSTLAKIERGAIRSPSIFTIQSIATALSTDMSALLSDIIPALPTDSKKTSASGIKFIYFDINGCLVRFFHRAFTELAIKTGVSPELIETTFWHYNDAVCRGEMTLEDFNSVLSKQLNTTDINWTDVYMSAVDPIEEMHELATWAAEHFEIGLLSNIMPGFISKMIKSGLLPDLKYHNIIDSSEVGAIKPETKIYEIAQEQSGASPGEILFIDDSRSNLMAGERMGWKVLWFDDYRPEESTARIKSALSL